MGFTISKNQGSGRTVVTVTPEEKNATDKDIVQILTVEAVDGSTKEVKLIHKKGEGNYEYTFRVSPTELYFEPTGESKEVTIVSTKQMVINGKKVGDPVNVNYTRENSGDATDLTFYVRGGRISKAAGWFGTALKICPLLNMDDEGHLIPRQKIRGKKAVIQQIVKEMENHAQGGHDYNGKCFISMSACYDDARAVADLVEEKFPHLNGKVMINNIGTTIGSHTGPGTVALFFWGDERTH